MRSSKTPRLSRLTFWSSVRVAMGPSPPWCLARYRRKSWIDHRLPFWWRANPASRESCSQSTDLRVRGTRKTSFEPGRSSTTSPCGSSVSTPPPRRGLKESRSSRMRSTPLLAIQLATQLHPEFAQQGAARLTAAGREADSVERVGEPAAAIIRAAEQWNANLVVLGSSGRSGLARLLPGSVVRHVLHGSHASVLIARAPIASSAAKGSRLSRQPGWLAIERSPDESCRGRLTAVRTRDSNLFTDLHAGKRARSPRGPTVVLTLDRDIQMLRSH